MKKESIMRNNEVKFFVAESTVQESALLLKILKDPESSGLEIGASTEYLWIDELLKTADPSLMRNLSMPLCGAGDNFMKVDCSSSSLKSSTLANDPVSYSSSDTLISSM